ncbi:Alpha/beta hydrolase fold-1 [Dillenia turbinata]|uniref:Alpha/beta hydrolase fold-1 n=1 Tax=Dillenia turbinata TaxID=194707 RepID=A0AAN8UD97_9MAGN
MQSFFSSAWPFPPLSYYLKPGLALLNRLSTLVVMVMEQLICLYYRFCGLSPCTIDLDDQTIMHFWIPSHRRFNKPDLVLLHGYGGNARWQFIFQVGPLAKSFNLYIPDLLFFGRSYTTRSDRTEAVQAECVREGLRRLGVQRFTLVGHSYGGFVVYRMAEMYPEAVEKIVIMSSAVKYTEGQKIGHLSKIGFEKDVLEVALLDNPKDLLFFLNLCMSLSTHHHKLNPLKWIPEFFLWGFINVTNEHSNERVKLVEHHLSKKGGLNPPVLAQPFGATIKDGNCEGHWTCGEH